MGYTLTRQDLQSVVVLEMTAWSMNLVVTSDDAELYPPKVFVFQAEDPADPETRGWFTAVASPAQLLEYPEDVPANEEGELQQPYYRKDSVQLVSRNPSDLETLAAQMLEELDLLTRNINSLHALEDGQVVGTT